MDSTRIRILLSSALLLACLSAPAQGTPMGTAFTYQGRLLDNNDVADNIYDFQFKLYSVEAGGLPLGTDVNVPDLPVEDGYFTAVLDFADMNLFDGSVLWLEIGVRPGDQNDPNAYTVLSPRQELTPTPFALSVRAPLELMKATSEPVLGVVNVGQGYAIAAAAGVKPAVAGICLTNGNYGSIGDVNGAVYGLAGTNSNAGYFQGDVSLHGDLLVADGGTVLFEHDGTIEFGYDAALNVNGSQDKNIGIDLDTTIGHNETRTISMNRTTTVGGNDTHNVGVNWNVQVNGDAGIEADDIGLNGNVGIGDISPTAQLDVDGDARFRKLKAGSGVNLVIDGNGYVYQQSSSERYKEDIRKFQPDGDAVLSLQPVRFRYKDTGQQDIGLIAEDVAGQAADLVIYDDRGRPDAVKYDRISLYLLETVRELKNENKQLKERISALEKAVSENKEERRL